MRLGIISDVHSNADALAAVLRAFEERGVREVISLGDVVGYNALPRQTITLLRKAGVQGVRGNHDLMVLGRIPPGVCGPRGKRAAEWTARVISPHDRAFLAALPPQLLRGEDLLFVHSRVGDPVGRLQLPAEFVSERRFLLRQYPRLNVCFTGHTHEQMVLEVSPDGSSRRLNGQMRLERGQFYFVNPGSVGEPRTADLRAAFAVYDSEHRLLNLHRVEYDRSRLLQENVRRGLARRESRVRSFAARVLVRARSLAAQMIPG